MEHEDLINLIAKRRAISAKDILSRSRSVKLVKARAEIAKILKNDYKLSYSQIGKILGRDHTTIIHLVKNIEVEMGEDILKYVNAIKNGDNLFYLTKTSNGGRWSKIILERGDRCEIPTCGFDDVLEIHHLISKRKGGTDEKNNVVIVCPNHHAMIHQGILKMKPTAFPHLYLPIGIRTDDVDIPKTVDIQ